jgi:hypothetical protein
MRLKVMAKELLILILGRWARTTNALDASNRRIVAEGGGEVKAIQSTDHTDYLRNL